MPRSFRTLSLAPLGVLAVAALGGCGGTELAATEDPQAHPPAAPVAARSDPAPAPIAAASAAPAAAAASRVVAAPLPPEPPEGWDFFGPPVDEEATDQAGPRTEHLHLRGFWDVDGRQLAQLWAGDESGGEGEMLLLAAGESRRGVTVVELNEAAGTATVEHPGRVVLSIAPTGSASRTRSTAADRPAAAERSRLFAPRPTSSRPEPSEAYNPPPPPPPPPRSSADRLRRGQDD